MHRSRTAMPTPPSPSSPREDQALGHHRIHGVAEAGGQRRQQADHAEVGLGRARDPTSSAPPTIESSVAASHRMPGRLPSDISSRPANSGPLPRAMIVPKRDAQPFGAGEETGLIGGDPEPADRQQHGVAPQVVGSVALPGQQPQRRRPEQDPDRTDPEGARRVGPELLRRAGRAEQHRRAEHRHDGQPVLSVTVHDRRVWQAGNRRARSVSWIELTGRRDWRHVLTSCEGVSSSSESIASVAPVEQRRRVLRRSGPVTPHPHAGRRRADRSRAATIERLCELATLGAQPQAHVAVPLRLAHRRRPAAARRGVRRRHGRARLRRRGQAHEDAHQVRPHAEHARRRPARPHENRDDRHSENRYAVAAGDPDGAARRRRRRGSPRTGRRRP